ncbi:MAG: phosphate acyltransferase, partial [Lachnospiraceae bacterium]|nr:phosphate acyltransferase [Lachnospiraceae bacterium]
MGAGIVDAVFVGCRAEIEADKAMPGGIQIMDAADPDHAAALAVAMVRNGEADIIMKGMINTDNLLRAILNKETGILDPGAVLTHITAAEIPAYRKVLLLTDVAVIPYPTLDQRRAQIKYLTEIAKRLGREMPKIALTHCSEKVDERHFPFTADYVTLKQEAERGKFGPCVV